MVGFERLYKDGLLGVVHGCGYDHPSLSHFSSMGFWHTGVPNGGESLGWLGRLADDTYDPHTHNMIVNIGQLAVARGAERPALAARLRRSGAFPPRGRRRREARARGDEPAEGERQRDARVSRVDRAERNRELGLRAAGVRRLPHAGGLRRRRRARRQSPARRVAHRGRHADAALLRHLPGQLVRHPRAAGGSPQPAADVHRRRGPRVHRRHEADRQAPTRWR